MPYKDKEKQKEFQRKHHLKNKAKYRKGLQNRRARNKEYAYALKMECSCGETNKACLDFHHENNKIKSVAQFIRDAVCLETLQKEIDKCKVICGNCHQKQHNPLVIEDGSNWLNFPKGRIEKRRWFIKFISGLKCESCIENDSRCLEFHHFEVKRFAISYLLTSGHSLDYLKEEITRCKILCTNCHRKLHSMVDMV